MPTIYYNQIRSALEAETEANKLLIRKLTLQVEVLTKQMNQLKTKWENLNDEYKKLQHQWNKKFNSFE